MPPSQAKGLGAVGASLSRSGLLAGSLFTTKANNEAKILPLDKLELNPEQPRRQFDQARLEELAEDIRVHGVLQPPIVRPMGEGADLRYQLVVGERRYRAARLAGLSEIPVIVREYDDQEAGAVSLVENLQREDLDLEDEARYFKRLSDEYGLSTRQIGQLISKGHMYVYKRLKLLERPDLLERVRQAELNLNTALDVIRAENEAEAEANNPARLVINTPSGSIELERDSEPASAAPRRSATPPVPNTWKKLNQFTTYLRQALPSFTPATEVEKSGLRQTIQEIEEQLAALKQKLEE